MKRTVQTLLLLGTVLLVSPASARADGFISPWVAANFGNGINDSGRGSYGFDAGFMGAGIIGAEFDFGYSPRFFGDQAVFGSNNVLSAMGNVIVGIPIGGQHGGGIRPFATGGLGLIRTDIDGLFDGDAIADNDFGFNLGGGVIGYFNDHFGVKGDVRYFRNLQDSVPNNFDLDLGGFHYWRAAVGVVIR